MLGNYPEETIQHSEHGDSLKSSQWWLKLVSTTATTYPLHNTQLYEPTYQGSD
jgi:hypothetical protein